MVVFSSDARVAEIEMRAILFVLVAFAYIDGTVDERERGFIRDTIDDLVARRAEESFPGDASTQAAVAPRWRAHFYQTVAGMEHDIRVDFTESVSLGESAAQFVWGRLKLRCFELLQQLDERNRTSVLSMVDGLMHADGVVHPAEQSFREELRVLLEEEPTRVALVGPVSRHVVAILEDARPLPPPQRPDHPFFTSFEHPYVLEPKSFARQAGADIEVIRRFEAQIGQQRQRGQGRLSGALHFSELGDKEPFLDGWVYVFPPEKNVEYELIVLGDLHGCYACLKAALLQAEFFTKVERYQADPEKNPFPLLVFLGDYIDRGRFSYDGILRTVLRLFLAAPPHVFILRGNHEHYVDRDGRVQSPVRPAEAIDSIAAVAPRDLLLAHMRLFDQLPSVLCFERLFFVHAGIPREDTIGAKLKSLSALNDPEIRLQMAWSDPSDADFVPLDLQRSNTRFPFGRMQFRGFMTRVGCSVMVRGHERVVEGLRKVYPDPDLMLLSLFSAGGATNQDLPADSNYREVTPMGLIIRHKNGMSRITPFPIAYERYNEPAHNGFLRPRSTARG
jgi:hypothetical protein